MVQQFYLQDRYLPLKHIESHLNKKKFLQNYHETPQVFNQSSLFFICMLMRDQSTPSLVRSPGGTDI